MSLKDNWTNKTDNVDNVVAEDINIIAQAVISDEEQIENHSVRITKLETDIVPKISLWQPNTSYEVGNVVLDKDIEECYIIGICKVAHVSGSNGSYDVSASGNWDILNLQVQYARASTYSTYADNAYSDGNGNDIGTTYATKTELRPTPITSTTTAISANNSYNYGEQTELSITFPTTANDGDVVYITFTSGATATVLTLDTTNTSDIELIPEANTGYEVYAKYNGTIWIVNYSDYTVTAEAGA